MAKKTLTPATYNTNIHRSQPTEPTIPEEQLKALFDSPNEDAKDYNNNTLIAELQSEAADAGSYAIGHNSTLIASLNVGDALEENRQALTDVVLGEIPDNTLTEAKMANEMKKIAGGVYPYNDGDANKTSIDTLNDRTDYGKTVGGTGDAITITTATGDWTFAVGESIKGIAIANSTGAVTCQVDGGTIYTVKKLDGSSYVACEADDFEDNKPFELIGQNDGGDFFLLAPRGGKNPMDDWNETTSSHYVGGNTASNLIADVTGSGWVVSVCSASASNAHMALEIDGVDFVGGAGVSQGVSFQRESSSFIMARYETGFKVRASVVGITSVFYLSGDDYEKAVLNVIRDTPSNAATNLVVNVTGEGWFYGGYGGVTSSRIDVDAVTVLNQYDLRYFQTQVKFNTSLQIYTSNTASSKYFTYTLLP